MQIYVVSLSSASERRKLISEQLDKLNLKYTFFDAVLGSQIYDIPSEYSDSLAHKNENRPLTKGEVGCAASHRNLYSLISQSEEPYALILEDDAQINPDLPSFLAAIEPHLKDSMIVTLERCDCYKKKNALSIYKDYKMVEPKFIREGSIAQTAGYIITKQAAELIKDINKPVSFPADSWGHYIGKVAFKGIIPSQTLIHQNIDIESQTQTNGKVHSEKKHTAIDFILWAFATETTFGRFLTRIYKKLKGAI